MGKLNENWAKNGDFCDFWKILWLAFLGDNLKLKIILLFRFDRKSFIWQNLGSQVTFQNAFGQSKVPKITSLQYLSNISKKEVRGKFDFLHEDNRQNIYKLIPSILVAIASHAQSTLNNKFTKYLLYLKNDGRGEVDFWAKQHQSFLQVDTTIFDGYGQTFLKFSE